jgi:hypothetical protein
MHGTPPRHGTPSAVGSTATFCIRRRSSESRGDTDVRRKIGQRVFTHLFASGLDGIARNSSNLSTILSTNVSGSVSISRRTETEGLLRPEGFIFPGVSGNPAGSGRARASRIDPRRAAWGSIRGSPPTPLSPTTSWESVWDVRWWCHRQAVRRCCCPSSTFCHPWSRRRCAANPSRRSGRRRGRRLPRSA